MVLGFDASTTCAGWAIYDGKDIVDSERRIELLNMVAQEIEKRKIQ